MYKRILSYFLAFAIVLTTVLIPTSFISTAVDTPKKQEEIIYTFDDVDAVENQPWEARNSSGGKAIAVSLESDSANVYGSTGKSLKVTYDTSKLQSGVAPSVGLKSGASITPKGDGLVFWIKSEKDTTVTFIAADAKYKDMKSPAIEVEKGAGTYYVDYADFTCSVTPDLSKMYLLQLKFYGTNEQNTIYVDNIGFFGVEVKDPEVFEPATGENLIYSFDDATSVEELSWEARNSNDGKALSISLESDATNVYGGTGKSLKVTYDTSKRLNSVAPSVCLKSGASITPKGDGLVFWIKSEKDTSVTLIAADAGYKDMKSPAIEVKKGEGMYGVKFSDFSCSSTPNLSRMYLLQFRFYNKNEQNTIYLDNIGFFKQPKISFLPGATELISGFDKYDSIDDMDGEWKPYSGTSTTLSIESNKENIYGDYNRSLKVSYDCTSADSVAGITYSANITTQNDGFVFWIKSEENTKIHLKAKDKNYKTVKTDDISISKGENTVIVKYDDFKASSGQADLSRLRNLSIIISGDNKSGTYYFDCFSFYFYAEPALHDSGFYECGIKASSWKKNGTSVATFKWDTDSRHYHTGKTGIKDTAALKLDYENLSTANTNSVYYDAALRANSTEPYIFGEDSVLSFWIYTEQEICLEICYDDKDTDNNTLSSKKKSFIIPAGESIIRQPMSELVPEGKQSAYMQVMQLQFRLYKSDGTEETANGSVWIDAIGFYNANPETNTTPQTHSNKTFVWWDFDSDKTIADTDWSERFGGPDGLGVKATIETDPQNAYGGEGRSLKIVCNPAEAQNNTPAIWLGDRRVTMYGKGFSFWVKSENPTKLRIIGVDANNKTVDAERWIKKGENIVTILWEDFRVVIGDSEAKVDMSTAYQFQIRATTQIYNTLWIDSIGYYDIVDDGSNAYKSLYPPESYDNWYDGVSVVSQNFNKYKGSSDMDFCCDWYFSNSGWIELENHNGNKMLRMDYDFSNNTSALYSEKNYTKIDPQGGISFWAKSSVERYYKLYLLMGEKAINIHVKIGPQGRYYKIPLSEFWVGSNINTSYEPDFNGTVTISRLRIYSDNTCNPPANNDAEQFSLWLDDLKFVDGPDYKRATAVDYYENGVRIKADKDAFATGITAKIDIVTTTPEEKLEYASKMGNSSKFINSYHIDAIDSYNISAIPQKAIQLIFDVPDGIDPEKVSIYQLYIDGTLAKRNNTTVTDDGKIKFNVYRLGDYVMGYSDLLPDNSTQSGDDSDLFGDSNTQTDNDSTQTGDNNTQTDDDNTQADKDSTQTGDNTNQTGEDTASADYYIYIIVAGGLFGIIALAIIFVYCRKRRVKKHEK